MNIRTGSPGVRFSRPIDAKNGATWSSPGSIGRSRAADQNVASSVACSQSKVMAPTNVEGHDDGFPRVVELGLGELGLIELGLVEEMGQQISVRSWSSGNNSSVDGSMLTM